MDFLRSVDMLYFDKMGQSSEEILAMFDIILHKIRNSKIYMGDVLIIFSIGRTQIQPIGCPPFLTSYHIISCLKTVTFENSVQDSNYDIFKRIHKISGFNYQRTKDEPDIVDEFLILRSENLTFVDTWDDNKITSSAMIVQQKRTIKGCFLGIYG